jgi:hypothetical protein
MNSPLTPVAGLRASTSDCRSFRRSAKISHKAIWDFFNSIRHKQPFHKFSLRESIGADYPLASFRSFRDRTNARSVAMNRASISGISLLGSLIDCPLCAARISA